MSGGGWIRTTVGVSQQIYSLPHLATLVHPQLLSISIQRTSPPKKELQKYGVFLFWQNYPKKNFIFFQTKFFELKNSLFSSHILRVLGQH